MHYSCLAVIALMLPLAAYALDEGQISKKYGVASMANVCATSYLDVPEVGMVNDPSLDLSKVKMHHQEAKVSDDNGKTYYVLSPLNTMQKVFGNVRNITLIQTRKGKAFLCVDGKNCQALMEVNSQ